MPRGGKRPGAGRKKGVPNRINQTTKAALLSALNHGKGAEAFFLSLKNSKNREDRRTFAHIVAKLVPSELAVSGVQPPAKIEIVHFSVAALPDSASPALPAAALQIPAPAKA